VLAIQGDFALHAKMLERIGAPFKLVKHAAELNEVSGLIMPGGESTTMLKFFTEEGFGTAIQDFAAQGKPIFGTCAGTILLAKEVVNPAQERLGLVDITVERNAYGRQIDSAVRQGECPELADRPVEMVFIRAPIIRRVGEGVRVRLAERELAGCFEALDEAGALVLRLADGSTATIAAGDVFTAAASSPDKAS